MGDGAAPSCLGLPASAYEHGARSGPAAHNGRVVDRTDAVVVGSGPNGLAAAITLARAGREVVVYETADRPGGGCRTSELTLPGVLHDDCSAVHPMALASPFFRSVDLAARGVRWIHPGAPAAHPLDGRPAAILERTVEATADRLGQDGAAWRRVFAAETASKGHKELMSYAAEVSPDYFETLRIRMIHGRGLMRQDNLGSPPVAVMSDYLAQRLFGKGKNPIGERIRLNGDAREIEIVGVVPNVQQSMLGTIRSQTMNLYLSQQQFSGQRAMVAIRTEKDSANLTTSVRKIVAEINPDLPLFAVRTMDELIALDQQFFRYLTWCMAVFSIVAGALAVLGIYGTVAYTVAQRTREFGVRLALGATVARLLSLVTLQAMKPVGVGMFLGVFASAWLVRPLVNSLFQNVADAEPWMFLSICVSLTISTGAACVIPAIKAARTNPVEALRHE